MTSRRSISKTFKAITTENLLVFDSKRYTSRYIILVCQVAVICKHLSDER